MISAELATYVGREGLLSYGGSIAIEVKSLDAREVYGRLDIYVEPVAGTGKAWVAESRIAWQADVTVR